MMVVRVREDQVTAAQYCDACRRIIGVGCACDLSFADKVKTTATVLPDTFKAVR
jgi:hypothetical protein